MNELNFVKSKKTYNFLNVEPKRWALITQIQLELSKDGRRVLKSEGASRKKGNIVEEVFLLILLKHGGTIAPSPHCVLKWGFTRTFPGSQDAILK